MARVAGHLRVLAAELDALRDFEIQAATPEERKAIRAAVNRER